MEKLLIMNRKKRLFAFISSLLLIYGCSTSVPNISTDKTYKFSTESLSESYLERKLFHLLNSGPGMVKELEYGRVKHPASVKSVIEDNPEILTAINLMPEINTRKQASTVFADFLTYLGQPMRIIGSNAGNFFFINSDGTGLNTITSSNPNYHRTSPSISPDGKKIVFFVLYFGGGLDFNVFTMDTDGQNETQLTFNPGEEGFPVWTPDGKILYYANINSNPGLYKMDSDGQNSTLFLENASQPIYSPDKTKIAYRKYQPGSNAVYLWVCNADGSNQHQVSSQQAQQDGFSWSPDSMNLVYLHENYRKIYTVKADGTSENLVKDSPPEAGDLTFRVPVWVKNNKIVYFYLQNDNDFNVIQQSINQINSDGSGDKILYNNLNVLSVPMRLSPNGKNILANIDGYLYSLRLDGTSNLTPVTGDGAGNGLGGAWVP
jgi:Tol biopolymer transport system component